LPAWYSCNSASATGAAASRDGPGQHDLGALLMRSLVLTVQLFVGAFLGIAAQFVLAVGVIFYMLPWIGLESLKTARAVADFDLPMKVLGLWWER